MEATGSSPVSLTIFKVWMKKYKYKCDWCGRIIDVWRVAGTKHIVFDCTKCGLCWESFTWVERFRNLNLEIFKQG